MQRDLQWLAKGNKENILCCEAACVARPPLLASRPRGLFLFLSDGLFSALLLVAKPKMMLILSLNSLKCKRENRLSHQYHILGILLASACVTRLCNLHCIDLFIIVSLPNRN